MIGERIINFIISFSSPIIIIVGGIVLYNIASIILSKIVLRGKTELEVKKRKTIIQLINNIVKYVIIVIALIWILDIYNVDTTGFMAGLGIAGIVVGFALQDAIKDIIGGINIILENYFIIGDQVKYNDFQGIVIEFGLKSTKIQASNGEVLVLSNRSVDKIVNLSMKSLRIGIDIPTSPDCEAKKVKKAIETVIEKVKKMDNVDPKGCEYVGIERIEPKLIIYQFKIKCKSGHQQSIRRATLELVKEAYDKEGLKFS